MFRIELSNSHCVVNEAALVEHMIQPRAAEVGYDVPSNLTCDFWEAVDEMMSQMTFVHYSQSDALQTALAQRYCPHRQVDIKHSNVHKKQASMAYVVINAQREYMMDLDDWLQAKTPTMEWLFQIPTSCP